MIRDRKDIPRFKDVSDAEWNDYRWQLRNRLTTTDDFAGVLHLTDAQRADLDACMGKFRVSVTPYYASLMDPDDSRTRCACRPCPTPAELVIHARGRQGRRLARTSTHRRRASRTATRTACSSWSPRCAACTAATARAGAWWAAPRTSSPRPRSTTPSSTSSVPPRSATCSSAAATRWCSRDDQLEDIIRARARHRPRGDHPHRHARMPVVCPQRITPELVDDAQASTTRCTSTRTSTTPRSSRPRASSPATGSPTPASRWATRRC